MSKAAFVQEALADFHTTASVTPSSRYLARAMVKPLDVAKAKIVVEFGPGTGVMTRELLAAAPADARILAFEINPRFVDFLRAEIDDPRLEVIAAGAETAAVELQRRGFTRVDAVLSSLGFGMMPETVSRDILRELMPLLDKRSAFTQFQYLHGLRLLHGNGNGRGKVEFFNLRAFLGEYFPTVQTSICWRNLPPAKVFSCRF